MKFVKGANLEVDFRYTNFYLASDPPSPQNQPATQQRPGRYTRVAPACGIAATLVLKDMICESWPTSRSKYPAFSCPSHSGRHRNSSSMLLLP